ncbi:hypothetical protein ACK8OR_14605 [Jannaschia sp. KMU-145]|uniref:hypothetical protein n=1 Tax=Jannaschia halovivens TaxID=3388667 RepID=UPI00396B0D57
MTTTAKTRFTRIVNLTGIAVPGALVAGVIAAGSTVMMDLRGNDMRTLDAETIHSVEFMSQAADAIETACNATGCLPEDLSAVISAGAAAMSEGDLREALRLQAMTLAENGRKLDAPGTTDAARATIRAETEAELLIASLYRAELRRR